MQITDPIMVRSLVRDEAAMYLAPFLHEDRSVAEASELLHLPLGKVHYWVRSLYDAGLLEIVAETRRKGRTIKRYQAVAGEFVVPAEALPDGYFGRTMRRLNDEMTDAIEAAAPEWVISGDFRISAASPTRGSRARVLRDRPGGPPTSHQSSQGLRITTEQAGQLVGEITALLDRWAERGDDASDAISFRIDVALAPMPD